MSNRANVNILIKYLTDCHLKREMATYKQMSALMYCDVRKNHIGDLRRALAHLSQRGIVFQCERNIGYIPIKANQIHQVAEQELNATIQRKADKWGKALSNVNLTALSDEEKLSHTAVQAKVEISTKFASPELTTMMVKSLKDVDDMTGKAGLSDAKYTLMKFLEMGY